MRQLGDVSVPPRASRLAPHLCCCGRSWPPRRRPSPFSTPMTFTRSDVVIAIELGELDRGYQPDHGCSRLTGDTTWSGLAPRGPVMNKEKLEGKLDEFKGKAEEGAGRAKEAIGSAAAAGGERAEEKGAVDQVKGAVRETVGEAEQDVGNAEDEAKDALRAAGEEEKSRKTGSSHSSARASPGSPRCPQEPRHRPAETPGVRSAADCAQALRARRADTVGAPHSAAGAHPFARTR